MKFICPKCNKETEIEVCMTDCIVSETVKFDVDGDPEYGTPKIHESLNSHYQCKDCGWKLPVEPNRVDDDALLEWLCDQPQNSDRNFAEELFLLIRKTGHPAVRFCGWTLDLNEMQSYPPPGLRGCCNTTYSERNLLCDSDLRSICRDFTRCAIASQKFSDEPVKPIIHTASDIDKLEELNEFQ